MNNIVKINFNIDGEMVSFDTNPDARLLDVIREDAGITAVREGCGEGECGACSILLNGKLVNSCSTPAINAHGKVVITSQGFSKTEEYKLIEASYAEAGAVQCGFCTPGFIMATAALFMQNENPTEEEIKTALSGNLCRCTGYTMILDAVRLSGEKLKKSDKPFFKKINKTSSTNLSETNANSYLPRTIKEALELVKKGYKPVAGGTDFLVRKHAIMKDDPKSSQLFKMFSTDNIEKYNQIKRIDNVIKIGATASLSEIIDHKEIPPVLKEALSSIASPGIRNAGTLAGNICNASPAGDSIPALFVLDATVSYYQMEGEKPVQKKAKIYDFITAPGKTILEDGIVDSIEIEIDEKRKYAYKKLGTRAANALSKLSIALSYSQEEETFTYFKLAIGACGPTVLKSSKAEELLTEEGKDAIDAVLEQYARILCPIDDQRSTASYRKNTALKLIKDMIINPGKYS